MSISNAPVGLCAISFNFLQVKTKHNNLIIFHKTIMTKKKAFVKPRKNKITSFMQKSYKSRY